MLGRLFFTGFAALFAAVALAQAPADLERQLASAVGADRARILASLTDALRQDNPQRALEYGHEALTLFAEQRDPENHVKTLTEMAWAYMTLADYENAIAYAERGRALAGETGQERGRARAINNLGVIAQRRGDALRAVDYFTEALAIYRRLGNNLDVSIALNNLGFVYSTDLADYDAALTYHVEALAVRDQLGDKSAIALSLNNIGIIYHRLGELDRAREYFERALALRRELGVQNRIAGTLHNIGDVLFDQRRHGEALTYHQQALVIRQKIGDGAAIASSLQRLGVVNTALKRPAIARRFLEEALTIASAAGERTTAAQSHLGLSAVDRQYGMAANAIVHAQQALAIAEQAKAPELLRQAWEAISRSRERAGDMAGALAAFKQFKEIEDRIFVEEKTKRVEVMERRYQTERREAEIQYLKAQQAADALQLNTQRSQRNAIVVGTLVLGLGGFFLYRRRVESAEIAHRLSVTDSLTGLRNRRFVSQTIPADTAVSARKVRSSAPGAWSSEAFLVFMLIDLDHFKSVNDQYGHDAGDRVLGQMAHVLRAATRSSDTLARWGGEEFLVICRFSNREMAALSAERIRMAVERHRFEIGGGRTLECSCSIGFASYPFLSRAPDAYTWEQVVAVADEALYIAKQSGRNAWVGVRETAGAPDIVEPFAPGSLRKWIAKGTVRIESSRPIPLETAIGTAPASAGAAPQPA